MKKIKTYNLISGLFFLTVGVFFALYARTVEIGTIQEPGPGFFPLWLGVILALLSLGLLIGTVVRTVVIHSEKVTSFFAEKDSWKRILAVFLAMLGYNLLLQSLGFTLVTFLFVGFLVKFIFPQSWMRAIITAVLSSIGVRLLFVTFLKIQLPKGVLGL